MPKKPLHSSWRRREMCGWKIKAEQGKETQRPTTSIHLYTITTHPLLSTTATRIGLERETGGSCWCFLPCLLARSPSCSQMLPRAFFGFWHHLMGQSEEPPPLPSQFTRRREREREQAQETSPPPPPPPFPFPPLFPYCLLPFSFLGPISFLLSLSPLRLSPLLSVGFLGPLVSCVFEVSSGGHEEGQEGDLGAAGGGGAVAAPSCGEARPWRCRWRGRGAQGEAQVPQPPPGL